MYQFDNSSNSTRPLWNRYFKLRNYQIFVLLPDMRKFILILLLAIFLFAQQGRVISYLSCKWETRAVAHCDCEKILAQDVQDDHHQLAKIYVHLKWEETLFLSTLNFVNTHFEIIINDHSNYKDRLPYSGRQFSFAYC